MKLRINNEAAFEDFFSDVRLLGVMAPIELYKFCWHLNQVLSFDFRIDNQLEINLQKKGRSYFFPVCHYQKPVSSLQHFLYSNHDDGEYLLPELKHFDFLWLMKYDAVNDQELKIFIDSVKSLPITQMVVELTPDKVKNKQNLVL